VERCQKFNGGNANCLQHVRLDVDRTFLFPTHRLTDGLGFNFYILNRSCFRRTVLQTALDNSDRTRVVNLKFCTLKSILLMTYNQYWFYVPLLLEIPACQLPVQCV
jgi:hypothetical protein